MKASFDQPQISNKLSSEELEKASVALKDALSWLDRNQLADIEEFQDKQKDLETVTKPLIAKLYQEGQGAQSCGQQERESQGQRGPKERESQGQRGPTIEE